jgi:pantoate--beta-alanine ligase
MQEISDPLILQRTLEHARCAGRSIGLVPTMGYLHAGHTRLMTEARRETDLVVASLFVNPTQFGPGEDFGTYPRDLDRDRALASQNEVDIIFVPEPDTMYPSGPSSQKIWVDPGELAGHLEGASRPGHFRGVTTVVAKLFNLINPDRAYFGQKDAQQAIIVTRMVADLAFPVSIRMVPTVRELDGLALSSRNVYLTPEERSQATALFASLQLARGLVDDGERDPRSIERDMQGLIQRAAPLARIDYLTVADLATLSPLDESITSDALISLAAFFGQTRLIDNLIVRFDGSMTDFS